MKKIQISKPIWKNRSVGLNIIGLQDNEEVIVEIMYIDKTGQRLYPGKYVMFVKDIKRYPIQVVRKYIKLHIVPIADLNLIDEK